MSDTYEPVIGLEIHCELKTKSKMFCSCANDPFRSEPNEHVCPICLGFPGTLPVPNKRAVELTLAVGKALHCQAAKESKFDRKNYFYPDLPKGYQISQYDLPFMEGGKMTVEVSDPTEQGKSETRRGKTVRIRRVHLEEDTGKLLHQEGKDHSLVDYNRAGVPLVELVTEPDLTSAHEAAEFAKELQRILRSQDASDADMEKGKMRVEANISLRKMGSKEFGTKVEVKNLNSFRSVERAIAYELERQNEMLKHGEKIIQETRGWDENKGKTFSQRTKEEAQDYRYFPEPDIPPLDASKWAVKIAELPEGRRRRYVEKFGLQEKQAAILIADRDKAYFFESALKGVKGMEPIAVANWVINEVILPYVNIDAFIRLMNGVSTGRISVPKAKEILSEARTLKIDVSEKVGVLESSGVQVISDQGELGSIVDEVFKKHPGAVADVKAGKAQALGFLVGQVMAKTKGQADPNVVSNLLQKKLQ